jgi:hypothetical protein
MCFLLSGSTWYLGAIVDFNNKLRETDETNNTLAGNMINVTEAPQYTIETRNSGGGTIIPEGPVTVTAGARLTFRFTPEPGYLIRDVLLDGESLGARSAFIFEYIDAGHTLEVSFIPEVYTITTTVYGPGEVKPSASITVPRGASQTLEFLPTEYGYGVGAIIVNGFYKEPSGSYTLESVTFDQSVIVRFVPLMHTINASAGESGSISPTGNKRYTHGSSASYAITPAAGYRIADVLVDTASVGAVPTYTFSDITAPHTITASFAANPTFAISAAVIEGAGFITPAGQTVLLGGMSQKYVVTPSSGFRIGNVRVNEIDQGAIASYTFSNVSADQKIEVQFIPDTLTITTIIQGSGTVDPSVLVSVPRGGSQTLRFLPGTGYKVDYVIVNGFNKGALDSYTFASVTSNQDLTVRFIPLMHTISASVGSNGSISPLGSRNYLHDTSATYSITPAVGYRIDKVVVDNTSVGAVPTYTFDRISAAHTISANFIPNPTFTITASARGEGTITPDGPTALLGGMSQKYLMTPAQGHRVGTVWVNGSDKGAISSYTFSDVNADQKIEVQFIPDTLSITTSIQGSGSVDPSTLVSVPRGGSQTVRFLPDAGYKVDYVLVNGFNKGALDSYAFTNVTSNQALTVRFVPLTHIITASAGANGSISPTGSKKYTHSSSATYSITPAAGFRVAEVRVDGVPVEAVTRYVFENITAPHTISASFAAN